MVFDPQANPAGNATTGNQGNPEEVILAGKYKGVTLEAATRELERGYLNQMAETQKIIAREKVATDRLNAVLPLLEGMGAQGTERMMPGDRIAARMSAVDELSASINVPREQLVAAMAEVAAAQLAPLTQGIEARQTVLQAYPDYGRFESEVAQFLSANPDVNMEFAESMRAGPNAARGALKYAYLAWKDRAGQTQNATTVISASGAEQAQARLDAMVPGSTGTRADASAAAAVNAREELRKQAQNTGNWTLYLRDYLKDVVPEWHMNPNKEPPPQGI